MEIDIQPGWGGYAREAEALRALTQIVEAFIGLPDNGISFQSFHSRQVNEILPGQTEAGLVNEYRLRWLVRGTPEIRLVVQTTPDGLSSRFFGELDTEKGAWLQNPSVQTDGLIILKHLHGVVDALNSPSEMITVLERHLRGKLYI